MIRNGAIAYDEFTSYVVPEGQTPELPPIGTVYIQLSQSQNFINPSATNRRDIWFELHPVSKFEFIELFPH